MSAATTHSQERAVEFNSAIDDTYRWREEVIDSFGELWSLLSDGENEVCAATKSDSDLDVLVTFEQPVTLFDLVRLENELTDQLGVEVDLVTKDSLKPQIESRVTDDLVFV